MVEPTTDEELAMIHDKKDFVSKETAFWVGLKKTHGDWSWDRAGKMVGQKVDTKTFPSKGNKAECAFAYFNRKEYLEFLSADCSEAVPNFVLCEFGAT